jgi:peptidoglycan/xylan/chitin deacetylase (PgdA/CDA1 family)
LPCALIYHDVVGRSERDAVGFGGPAASRYKLEPHDFDRHLEALAASGTRVGLVEPGRPWPETALTFDDGGASAMLVARALEARGWRGHFFITTARIDTPGFMTAGQVRELADRGHMVGSHSHTHPGRMSALSRPRADVEWRQSREILAGILRAPPELASVPGGFVSDMVVRSAAEAGYRVLMTSEPSAKPRTRHGILVTGRYAIWARTSPRRAAAYARGARGARLQLWLGWNAKGAAKRWSPQAYAALRQFRAR